MKICPICGSKFSGSETFCPHDGARLYEAEQPAQLEGQELHHAVRLERLIFKDAFGERYFGEVVGTGDRVKVTVFNQAFKPKVDRIASLASTKALLDTPMPAQISSTFAWDIESSPGYLIETAPRGASLRLLLDERGSLDWRVALKITCSLARSLEWMDNQGVVHRALQPEAIHITDIQKGYANLTEWGLGVLAYQDDPLEALKKGNLIASAAYMAPELITSAGGADRKSSIYSLGLLLYEMLTGKSPFRAPDTEEMLKRQRREKPARLSTVYEGQDLPAALDDLFEVITHKLPEQRFQSLGALVNALSSMLDDGTSASDFPEPTRADDEPNIVIKPNGVRKKKKKKKQKKTLLFISADEIEKASKEQGAAASVASDASASTADDLTKDEPEADATAEAKSVDVDDASAATVKMKAEVLEEDKRSKEAEAAPKAQVTTTEPQTDTTEVAPETDVSKQGEPASSDADQAKPSGSEVKGTGGTTDTEPPKKEDSTKPKRRKKKRAPKETVKLDTEQLKDSNKVSIDDPIETGEAEDDPREGGTSSKVILDEELTRDEDTSAQTSGESKTKEKSSTKKSTKGSTSTKGKSAKSKATSGKSTTTDTKDSGDAKGDAKKEETKPSATKSSKSKKSKSSKSKTDTKSTAPEDKTPAKKSSTKKSSTKSEDEDDKKTKTTKKSTTPAATASMDDNMEDIWFSTDTEAAWDREILMEHTARSEAKVRNYITVALVTLIIAAVSGMIYVVFVYEGDPDDEEASLHTDDVVEMMVASTSPHAPPKQT